MPASFRSLFITLLLTFAVATSIGCSDSTSLRGGDLDGGDFTVEARISSSQADAEESANGEVSLDGSDLELGYDENDKQVVGLQFGGIEVPRGATITDAWIRFATDEATSIPASLMISGEASHNSTPFTTTTRNITSRTKASATTPWSVRPWPVSGLSDVDQTTPDLSAIVQEIINLSEWEKGGVLTFFLEGSGTRIATAYDGDPAKAPLLHIGYEANGSSEPTGKVTNYRISSAEDDVQERSDSGEIKLISDSINLGYGVGSMEGANPVVGLRFNNIDVQQGASINNAYIQFTSNLKTFDPFFIGLTIYGEAADSSAPFEGLDYSLSSRTQTEERVYWEPSPWAGKLIAGPDQRTVDISNIISEIIQRPGWESGNSLALMIAGPGEASTRVASAYENDPDFAPLLHIEVAE